MILNAFIVRLTSIIIPTSFQSIIANIVLFEKFADTQKRNNLNLLFFSLIVILVSISFSFILGDSFNSLKQIGWYSFGIDIISLFFFIFLLIYFIKKIKLPKIISILGILILSLSLIISSFSNLGPLMGSLIIGNQQPGKSFALIQILFGFSLGLIIPFSIIQFFVSKKYKSLRLQNWWRIIQIVLVSYLILASLLKIFYWFMVFMMAENSLNTWNNL